MFRIFSIVFLSFFSGLSFSQQLMINEVSQGTGAAEYVELVVIGNPICEGVPIPSIDLKKVIIDDNNGFFKSGVGTGIAGGALRFANTAFWSSVPQGTFIVIYNELNPNSNLPNDDLSLTDGNCTLIIPANSSLLESTTVSPTASPFNPQYPIADSDWGPSVGWNVVAMANSDDSFQIPNLGVNGTPLHSVSWGNNNDLGNAIIFFAGSSAGQVMSFKNVISNDFNDQANWVSESVSATTETPGAPNSLTNDLWIGTMNPTCRVNPALNFTITNSDCGASNGSVVLTVANATNIGILWENGNTTNTITNLAPGVYTVTVTDNLTTCTFTDSATVALNNSTLALAPVITDESCTNLCDGIVQLNITGGQAPITEVWKQNNVTITKPTSFCAGTYEVEVNDANNCPIIQIIQVNLANPVVYTVSNDTTICLTDSSTLTINGIGLTNIVWSTGAITNSITVSPLQTISFTITASANTCTINESINVSVDNCDFGLEFPNIFTPNADSKNDFYIPVEFAGVTNKGFVIINRWGEIMYETTEQIIKWDGKSQDGKEASEGVYFYKLLYNEPSKEDKILHGFLHLERK